MHSLTCWTTHNGPQHEINYQPLSTGVFVKVRSFYYGDSSLDNRQHAKKVVSNIWLVFVYSTRSDTILTEICTYVFFSYCCIYCVRVGVGGGCMRVGVRVYVYIGVCMYYKHPDHTFISFKVI